MVALVVIALAVGFGIGFAVRPTSPHGDSAGSSQPASQTAVTRALNLNGQAVSKTAKWGEAIGSTSAGGSRYDVTLAEPHIDESADGQGGQVVLACQVNVLNRQDVEDDFLLMSFFLIDTQGLSYAESGVEGSDLPSLSDVDDYLPPHGQITGYVFFVVPESTAVRAIAVRPALGGHVAAWTD